MARVVAAACLRFETISRSKRAEESVGSTRSSINCASIERRGEWEAAVNIKVKKETCRRQCEGAACWRRGVQYQEDHRGDDILLDTLPSPRTEPKGDPVT